MTAFIHGASESLRSALNHQSNDIALIVGRLEALKNATIQLYSERDIHSKLAQLERRISNSECVVQAEISTLKSESMENSNRCTSYLAEAKEYCYDKFNELAVSNISEFKRAKEIVDGEIGALEGAVMKKISSLRIKLGSIKDANECNTLRSSMGKYEQRTTMLEKFINKLNSDVFNIKNIDAPLK